MTDAERLERLVAGLAGMPAAMVATLPTWDQIEPDLQENHAENVAWLLRTVRVCLEEAAPDAAARVAARVATAVAELAALAPVVERTTGIRMNLDGLPREAL